MENQELINRIDQLEKKIESLKQEFYNQNFSAYQTFPKYSNFTTALKVPNYSSAPTSAQVGEIIEISGKLYICSSADTFVVVGTQS